MFLLPLFESQDFLSRFSHCLVETAELGFYRFLLKGLEPASDFQLKCCLGLCTFGSPTLILLMKYSFILVLRTLMATLAINSW